MNTSTRKVALVSLPIQRSRERESRKKLCVRDGEMLSASAMPEEKLSATRTSGALKDEPRVVLPSRDICWFTHGRTNLPGSIH